MKHNTLFTNPDAGRFRAGPVWSLLLRAMALMSLLAFFLPAAGAQAQTHVDNESALRNAFPNAAEIDLDADITLTCDGGGELSRSGGSSLTIRGNGHTLTQACDGNRIISWISSGALTIENLTLTMADGVTGGSGGGAIDAFSDDFSDYDITITVINSTLTGNSGTRGGAINAVPDENVTVTITVINSTLTGNSAIYGGAINAWSITDVTVTVINSTLTGNWAGSGGAIFATSLPTSNVTVTVRNSIVYGNSSGILTEYDNIPDVSWSLVQGHTGGEGNLNGNTDDPLFVNPRPPGEAPTTEGDYRLLPGSPAINAGSNQSYTDAGGDLANDLDLAGNPRLQGEAIDMGAYEFHDDPVVDITPDGDILYVNQNAEGDDTGSSWANAIPELADALNWAREQWDADEAEWDETDPLQIWVAEGTYLPLYHAETMSDADPEDRDNAFVLVPNVQLYGGFKGEETSLDDRDWEANETILSGDFDENDDPDDPDSYDENAHHVVIGAGNDDYPIDENTVLDGFTITGGSAEPTSGGTLTVNGATIINNRGGGMYNTGSSPELNNVTLSGNRATGGANASGGGIYNESNSSPTLTNVTFSGNQASSFGGGIYNESNSSPALTNVTLSGNQANNGGGMFNNNSSPTLTNVTLSGNQADFGGGMHNNSNSDPTLVNTLIWGNNSGISGPGSSTITYSLVQGVGPDNDTGVLDGNADHDLLFLSEDPDDEDFLRLHEESPAINTGYPLTDLSLFPGGPDNPVDLAGNDRVHNLGDGGIIDMGAYEFQGDPAVIGPDGDNILYVNIGVTDGNETGDSWENAIPELADALNWAADEWDGDTEDILQIWVAAGVYLPTDDDTDREATFRLVDNVEIYGGFDGTESDLEARDWQERPTVLSGDIDDNDTTNENDVVTDPGNINGGNSYHVVIGSGTDESAVLDGFYITAGLANGGGDDDFGAGMYNFNGSPTLTNVILSGNTAGFGGGGMLNNSSSPTLTNVTLSGNTAGFGGGGMYNFGGSSPTLANVTISGNTADIAGGGMYNDGGNPSLVNTLIWGNNSGIDGPGSSTITYSLVQGVGPDNDTGVLDGNADHDLLFLSEDPDDEDFLRLHEESPAINTGDPFTDLSLFPGGPDNPVDLAGNDRVHNLGDGGIIDMGAYEFQGDPAVIGPDGDNILYVNIGVPDGNETGDSWENAIPELRDALAWAADEWDGSNPPLQIWVAAGVYLPTDDVTDREATFRLVDQVEIYGGFAGSESDLEARDWQERPTVLSGDIGGDDDANENGVVTNPDDINDDNSYHVVTGSGTDETAVLDGFYITAGLANGGGVDNFGAGMYNNNGSPTLTNVTFSGNSAGSLGGGMANAGGSDPTLTNVTLSGNQSNFGGGMVNADGSDPTLTNVTISGNRAGSLGGGMYNDNSSPTLTNVTLSGNTTASLGGGMTNFRGSSPTLTNVTIFGNTADNSGGGMTNLAGTDPTLTNTLIWGNNSGIDGPGSSTITYSLVQGHDGSGTGNLPGSTDPRFLSLDPDDDDFLHLSAISPAINAGSNDAYADVDGTDLANDLDLAGSQRVFNYPDGIIDIGAYEFQGDPILPAAGVTFTGGEGWRFLGNPSQGDTFAGFLGPIRTQGVPGSDNETANNPSVLLIDQVEYEWDANFNMNDESTPGTAFIVYVFEDDAGETLHSGDQWLPLNGEFQYEGLLFDGGQGDEGDSHFLIANPHPISLDFCEMYEAPGSAGSVNIAGSIDIWDPAANDGNGSYETLSCEADDVHIAPFQAFWIRTLEDDPGEPLLGIPEEAYLTSQADGYFKQSRGIGTDLHLITLNVQSGDEAFSDRARILFSEEGTLEMDRYDAPKLSPAGLAPRWLNFYALDEADRGYAFRSLPADFGEQISIPLHIETTEAGAFELSWSLPDANAFAGSWFLRDNHSGEVIELTDGQTYRFQVNDVAEKRLDRFALADASPLTIPHALDEEKPVRSEPRFDLLAAAPGVDGFAGLGDLPEQIALDQNYPNPFNPATVIRFELPQASDVRLAVYDMLGRRVATLVDGQVSAGRHTVNFDATSLASGVYMYRLQTGTTVMSRKLTVIK